MSEFNNLSLKDKEKFLRKFTDKNSVNASWFEIVDAVREERDEILSALKKLLECSRCQNNCAPDDMTCATNLADRAIENSKKRRI